MQSMHMDRLSPGPLNRHTSVVIIRVNAHEVDNGRRDEFVALILSSALFPGSSWSFTVNPWVDLYFTHKISFPRIEAKKK